MNATRRRRSPRHVTLATDVTELALAAPQVVAHRVSRMLAAGPQPSPRDQREFTRMVTEKQVAFSQSWWAMAAQAFQAQQRLAASLWRGWWLAPWAGGRTMEAAAWTRHWQTATLGVLGEGLKPVHRKAVANAKRLNKLR